MVSDTTKKIKWKIEAMKNLLREDTGQGITRRGIYITTFDQMPKVGRFIDVKTHLSNGYFREKQRLGIVDAHYEGD